ncbi:phage protein GemA/Gp16 family protein [Aliarcobacter butzleri]
MTNKQRAYKQALIKQVHTSKLYIDVYSQDRELYEDMLQNNFGVKSSKDLSIDGLMELVKFLQGNPFTRSKKAIKSFKATTNQTDYILTLWQKNSLYKDVFSLFNFAKKIIKKEINSLDELNKNEARTLINAVLNIKPVQAVNNINYKGF